MGSIKSIINISELIELDQYEDLILVDAGSGPVAKENYLKNHLKGALYVDLNDDLSDIKKDTSNGGRHPLPTPEQFSETLSNLGVSNISWQQLI